MARCAVCGDSLRFKKLSERCPYCGNVECYADKYGYARCSTPVDGEWFIDLRPRRRYAMICGACEEAFSYNVDTIVVTPPKVIFRYQADILFDPEYKFGSLAKPTRQAIVSIVRGTIWHRTDAWRGYSQPPRRAGGYVMVVDGWHSSMEDSPFAKSLNNLMHTFSSYHPIIVVFGRTSNVCTTGVSVFAYSKDADKVAKALDLRTSGVGGVYQVQAQ